MQVRVCVCGIRFRPQVANQDHCPICHRLDHDPEDVMSFSRMYCKKIMELEPAHKLMRVEE